MRLRTSPQSNSPQGSHRLVGCSSFNEAADFAAEQPQQSAYPPQPNPSFNEAADFAAEQRDSPTGYLAKYVAASMRLRTSPQSNPRPRPRDRSRKDCFNEAADFAAEQPTLIVSPLIWSSRLQ